MDADDTKKELPEYGNGIGAQAVHEESTIIAGNILRRAVADGLNLVHPILGRTIENVRTLRDNLAASGYDVHLVHVDLPIEKAAQRSVDRFASTGRFIDPQFILKIGDAPKRNYATLKSEGGFKSYAQFSNDVPRGQQPQLTDSHHFAALRSLRGGGAQRDGAAPPLAAGTPGPAAQTPAVTAAAAAGLTPDEIKAQVRAALAASRGPAPAKSRIDRFMEAYEQNLRQAITNRPDEYTYGLDYVPQVLQKMRGALLGNTYATSAAITKTAKQLGVPTTRKGLHEWLHVADTNEPPAPPTVRGAPPAPVTAPRRAARKQAPPLAPASISGAPPAPDANPLRAAGAAARDRLRAKYNGSTLNSGVDPQDLIDLSTIGAEHIIDGALKFKDWVGKVMGDLGELVHKIARSSDMTPEALLREVHSYAAPAAAEYGAIAEPPPPLQTDEEKRITETEGSHGAGDTAGAPDSGQLAEVLPEGNGSTDRGALHKSANAAADQGAEVISQCLAKGMSYSQALELANRRAAARREPNSQIQQRGQYRPRTRLPNSR